MRAHLLALLISAIGCAKPGAAPAAGEGTTPTAGAPAAPGAMAKPGMGLVAPAVPPELAVPEGQKLTYMAAARGVQIYECAADAAGALAWKLHAPRADLVDDSGAPVASHFGGVDKNLPPGPYWQSTDGSRVHGGSPASVPNPGSIPRLRRTAVDTSGSGVFSHVSYIQRLDTTGGVSPTGACTAGERTEVPYTAKYYFYAAP